MEQIVKIFVHQSYFIENDLVVDYNVEQGAHVNVSPKDWIALIPKGWSGVDEQVVFKTVNTDSDVMNLAIKSVVMEKKCFQNVVECEKQYQLMYIGQYLEILGRSEYFIFLHQSGTCNCVSPSTPKTETKESSRQSRLSINSSVFTRKSPRRQSPTPREFYKNRLQLQNTVKYEKSATKQWATNTCNKCTAPNNYMALESAYLTKIQDLTIHKEMMEQRLIKTENDLVQTLEVVNKQFKLSKAISQQKDNIQKFIDDVVSGLLNDGKISFWAHDQEFSVVREFPGKNQTSLVSDECTSLSFNNNKSPNSSKEAYMKAIIGQQEQTIQHLVNKIKDSFDLFVKVNTQSSEQNNSVVTSSENKLSNIGYMDSSGTTYFSPPSYINDTLNDFNMYLSNNIIENPKTDKNAYKWEHDITGSEYPSVFEPKVNKKIEDKILTFEDLKKDKNKFTTYASSNENCTNEKKNELDNNTNVQMDKCDIENSDGSH